MKALNLTYSTMIIVNQREEARGEEGEVVEQARAEENYPLQIYTYTSIHM